MTTTDTPIPRRSYQIFVSTPVDLRLTGLLGRLARLFSLDVYGPTLLTRRVAIALRYGALMLLIVAAFELLAWVVFFNAIIHSTADVATFDGLTFLALFLGGLIAVSIVIFEQQLFTADLEERGLRKWLAIGGRVVIIFASALITSRPVELIVFRGPITTRTHEEQTFHEAARQYQAIIDRQGKLQKFEEKRRQIGNDVRDSNIGKALTESENRLNTTQSDLATAESNHSRALNALATARRRVDSTQGSVRNAQNELTSARRAVSEDDPETERRLRRAERALRNAQAAHANAISARESAQKNVDQYAAQAGALRVQLGSDKVDRDSRMAAVEKEEKARHDVLQSQTASVEGEMERLRDYMKDVIQHGANRPVTKHGYHYEVQQRDFFQQLRLVEDLRSGQAPRWVGPDDERKKLLVSAFALPYIDPNDRDAMRPLKRDAVLFTFLYYAAMVVAMVIPMFVLLTKLLMPGEVRSYYSREHQRQAGNPEAILISGIQGDR